MRNRVLAMVVALTCAGSVTAQAPRPPVIDMHVHSTTTNPARLASLQALNVRYVFLAGLLSDLRDWRARATAGPVELSGRWRGEHARLHWSPEKSHVRGSAA